MSRHKTVHKRFLIGLDRYDTQAIVAMSDGLCLTYSEVVSYLIRYYQLGKAEPSGK
jgi:hypothetical protein